MWRSVTPAPMSARAPTVEPVTGARFCGKKKERNKKENNNKKKKKKKCY